MAHLKPQQPGRHWERSRTLAKRLDVRAEWLDQLIGDGKVEGFTQQRGRTTVFCVYVDESERIARLV